MDWFANPENSKALGLVIFFLTFCMILIWVFGSRKRGKELEEHRNIPFLEDDEEVKDKSNG